MTAMVQWLSWYDCHTVISCFIKICNGLLVLPVSPGKDAVTWMSLCCMIVILICIDITFI